MSGLKKTKGKSSHPKRPPVPRQTLKFQLRKGHPEDDFVADILKYATAKRQAQPMIRDGIRLIWALRQWESGQDEQGIEVLFEMFPRLRERFSPALADLLQQFSTMMVAPRPAEKHALAPVVPPPPPKLTLIATSETNTSDELLSQFL